LFAFSFVLKSIKRSSRELGASTFYGRGCNRHANSWIFNLVSTIVSSNHCCLDGEALPML